MTDKQINSDTRDIGCLEAINGLYAYLDGEMNDLTAISEFEQHLNHCRACYSRTQLEAALADRIRKHTKGQATETLQRRLQKLIDEL